MTATTTSKRAGNGKGSKTGTMAAIEEQRAAYTAWYASATRSGLGELRNAVTGGPLLFPAIDPADYSEVGLRVLFLEPEAELIRVQKQGARSEAIRMFASNYYGQAELDAYLIEGEMDPYVPRAEVRVSVGITYYPTITSVTGGTGGLTSTVRAAEQDRLRDAVTAALASLGEGADDRSLSVDVRVARSSRG